MPITHVKKRWAQHAEASVYDRLSISPGANVVLRAGRRSAWGRWAGKLWPRVSHSPGDLPEHDFVDKIADRWAFWLALATRADIITALGGDEQLDPLSKQGRRLASRLVATCHLPAERVKRRVEELQREELQRLAGAIVVASPELELC